MALKSKDSTDIGVDVQYPWEDSPRRYHEHDLRVNPFWIDKFPVTNAEFKKFLDGAHYQPKDDLNFLRDWQNGTYPEGWEDKPVTWVSLEDARAYAAWAGKRLPSRMGMAICCPRHGWAPLSVGKSVGCFCCPHSGQGPDDEGPRCRFRSSERSEPLRSDGPGWQCVAMTMNFWMSIHGAEFCEAGSYYQPRGSIWYFPQEYKLTAHGKLLMMAPSMDRSGAVGFRCVQDAQ